MRVWFIPGTGHVDPRAGQPANPTPFPNIKFRDKAVRSRTYLPTSPTYHIYYGLDRVFFGCGVHVLGD